MLSGIFFTLLYTRYEDIVRFVELISFPIVRFVELICIPHLKKLSLEEIPPKLRADLLINISKYYLLLFLTPDN